MKRLAFLALAAAAPAPAALSERELARAAARPPMGAQLPAALAFADQHGVRATLGAVAGARPLVLLFADYTCRHVCGPGLALTAAALRDARLTAGRDYALAVIGVDAKDGIADARAMAERIGDAGIARQARLLRGDAGTIAAAERALGYGVAYDAAADQFAHDASVYVFAPDGRLAALLPELALRPEALRTALTAPPPAGRSLTVSLTDRVARLCYGFGAAHGRYAGAIVAGLQVASLLLLVGLAWFFWRRRRAA